MDDSTPQPTAWSQPACVIDPHPVPAVVPADADRLASMPPIAARGDRRRMLFMPGSTAMAGGDACR